MFDAFDLVAPVNALRNVQSDDAYVALGKKGMIVHTYYEIESSTLIKFFSALKLSSV